MSAIPTRSRLPGPTPSRLPAPSTKRLASVDLEQGQGEAKKKKLEKGDSSSSLPETNKDLSKAASKFTVGRGGPTKPPGRLPNSMMSGRATTIGARNAATSVSAARENESNELTRFRNTDVPAFVTPSGPAKKCHNKRNVSVTDNF